MQGRVYRLQADLCCLYGVCAFGSSPDVLRNEPHSANSFVTTYSLFNVLLAVHLSTVLVINKFTAQNLVLK